MNKKNNQQSNKTTKTSPPLEEGTEGWSENNKSNSMSSRAKRSEVERSQNSKTQEKIKDDTSLRGGTTKQSQSDNNTATNHKTSPPSKGGDVRRTEGVLPSQLKQCDIAVKVTNVSKTFKIPHAKIDSMRSVFVNMYKKRTYEKFNALDNVSFEVKKGEFLGIIGHNGAGKSTLLKILAGVYVPSEGDVEINGMISPFLELGIGFNPELSGRDNVYLNATVLGLTKKQIDEKFDEIVAFAELEKFIDEQLKNYSSGMKARLAFSVSIHADREILIMDEVLAVGDSRFKEKCLDIFKGYKDKGKTVILVTHSMATVRDYCDRALLLDKGEILGSGDVDEVCDEYLCRNMSEDELKVLEKKEKLEKKSEERIEIIKKEHKKQQKVEINEINDIKFLNGSKKVTNEFNYGEDISIRIKITKIKDVNNLNIGVGLYSDGNDYIFGCNTQMDSYNVNNENIELVLKENSILPGKYYINVVCFGEKEEEYYDLQRQAGHFLIMSKKGVEKYRGIINLKHRWK